MWKECMSPVSSDDKSAKQRQTDGCQLQKPLGKPQLAYTTARIRMGDRYWVICRSRVGCLDCHKICKLAEE